MPKSIVNILMLLDSYFQIALYIFNTEIKEYLEFWLNLMP